MAEPPGGQVSGGTPAPVTVVTGGTDGIGYELAREFARAGNDLLLVARSADGLSRAAARIGAEFGVRTYVVAADLASCAGCDAVEAAVAENGLRVEYLVNNAGVGLAGLFAELDRERLLAMVDLNVRAGTDLMRRFLPGMIARREGGVLNLGSLAGFAPGPYQQVYYASKAYVISLTQAVAHEARHSGVRISVVTPGPVDTRFHARMGAEKALYMHFGLMRPEAVARIAFRDFMRGRRVIAPGILNKINHLLLRFMPRVLLVPFMGLLLKERSGNAHAQAGKRRVD